MVVVSFGDDPFQGEDVGLAMAAHLDAGAVGLLLDLLKAAITAGKGAVGQFEIKASAGHRVMTPFQTVRQSKGQSPK
jgi:hypothetical protein